MLLEKKGKRELGILILLFSFVAGSALQLSNKTLTVLPVNPNDCVASGQPSITDTLGGGIVDCHHIYYEGNLGFSFIQTWDPSWDYETYTGSLLGGPLYDLPVTHSGIVAGVAGIGATSAITNIADNGAGAMTFTIRTGMHAHEINGSGTLHTYGPLTGADWAYSFTRTLAACNAQGPASAVYIWIAGAMNWLNTCTSLDPSVASNRTALATAWNTFTALGSITSTATTFTIKTSGNLSNIPSKYTPFLSVLANSWAAVYPQSVVTAACGEITAGTGPSYLDQKNLDEQCHGASPDQFFDDNGHGNPVSIGSGPYILDQKLTSVMSGVIYLRHNDNYCPEHGGASACDEIGSIAGPVNDADRPTYLVIRQVTYETARASALNNGTYDHSFLASTSYPTFLQNGTTPPFNALLPSQQGKFNFRIIPSTVVQDLQMIVHCNAADGCSNSTRGSFVEYPLTAISPLLGDCSPTVSPGCHVRIAIQYAFDYNTYLSSIALGLGTMLATMMPDGLPTGNTCAQGIAPGCSALGGDLNTGPYVVSLIAFSTDNAVAQLLAAGYNNATKLPHIQCVYTLGSDARARACTMLANSLESLRSCKTVTPDIPACDPGGLRYDPTCSVNSSCTIVTGVGVQAPTCLYCNAVHKGLYDIAGSGWLPDYVDEDDYARPYFYSTGIFQLHGIGFNSSTVDSDINSAGDLAPSTSRDQAYFHIENETNALCHCFIWLQQSSGRAIWNAAISTHVFGRIVNPAFLPVYLDISKITCLGCFLPVFPTIVETITLTLILSCLAVVLRRRNSSDQSNYHQRCNLHID